MAENNFNDQLLNAVDAKSAWFDGTALPEVLENYRLLHSCVKNLFEYLLKKAMITPDPYKNDKKISDIIPPENTGFSDNEKAMVMGMRFSDYENTMDFLCNYYKFSVSNLQLPNIRKLVDLNNSIQWNNFTVNSSNINTRTLSKMLLSAHQSSDQLTASMINDSISKAGKALLSINRSLKELTDFQRENYKANIRRTMFTSSSFNYQKALSSPEEELTQIKKNFTAVMGKIPFYNELINEIINEDQSAQKEKLRQELLKKLEVEESRSAKKEVKIDTKEMLLTALRIFGAIPGQILEAKGKIQENHDVLESEHNSFMDKFKKALRKAFGISEKPVFYQITVTDQDSDTKHHEKLDYFQFLNELENKARRYSSVGVRKAPGYEKIAQQKEDKILEYVNQQIQDCQKLIKTLNGLDDFFKNAPVPSNRPKIKGLKMEITAIKNSVVKANQHRSEYSAYIEEESQLRKLGISND